MVSDFSLIDAIESGIVKIPRVPVDDDRVSRNVTYLDLWREIRDDLPKTGRRSGVEFTADDLPHTLQSRTDRTQGLKVPDALAVIVGDGGHQPAVDAWGWFVYQDDDYRELGDTELAMRLELVDDTSDFVTITLTKAVEAES